MSRSQSSPDAIERLFIKSVLTKVCSDNGKPTYSRIEILQNELISNAVSVRSSLGDGLAGHLFLVVSDDDYSKATVGNLAKPVVPVKLTPPTLVIPVGTRSTEATSAAHNIYRQEHSIYREDLDDYIFYHNTSKYLVKQMVSAVPFLEELEDPIVKFGNVDRFSLLEHLKQSYCAIIERDLEANVERMKAK